MSGLFSVLCGLLLLSALEFAPSEASPSRQTRELPDFSEGIEPFKKMAASIMDSELFNKFSELAKDFITKTQDMLEEFMKSRSRREISGDAETEVNSHRVARQIPGVDQAMKTGQTFVKTGTDLMSKAPEVGAEMMKKATEMGSQFIKPGRRRRSPHHFHGHAGCHSGHTTAKPE